MADLNDEQKREIVEQLACFRTPVEVVAWFQSEYGIELDRLQVGRYDPSRTYYAAGEKWREVFELRRAAYLSDVSAVPAANQAYRLQTLQEGIEAAKKAKNWPLVAQLLEQSAKEVGGVLTNQRELKVDDSRRPKPSELSPEDRKLAVAEIIRQAMESRPLPPPQEQPA